MENGKQAFGYLRVSTKRQAAEGESLESQAAKVKAFCELRDHVLVDVLVDRGVSGRKAANRPKLQEALDRVCESGGVLVCYSLSRLARSTKDAIEIFERLDKAGADLVLLNQDIDTRRPGGRLVFKIMAAMAEYESEMIGERVKDIWDYKKSRGEKCGGQVPFGFRVKAGKLLPVQDEIEAIMLMEDLRGAGKTLRQIALALELRGIKTKGGKAKWAGKVIRGILIEAEKREEAKKQSAAA